VASTRWRGHSTSWPRCSPSRGRSLFGACSQGCKLPSRKSLLVFTLRLFTRPQVRSCCSFCSSCSSCSSSCSSYPFLYLLFPFFTNMSIYWLYPTRSFCPYLRISLATGKLIKEGRSFIIHGGTHTIIVIISDFDVRIRRSFFSRTSKFG
jgi:hypothetical protein